MGKVFLLDDIDYGETVSIAATLTFLLIYLVPHIKALCMTSLLIVLHFQTLLWSYKPLVLIILLNKRELKRD